MTILTIYFAIVSLYRTTSFFIRITFFFVKWGALLGFLIIGLGSLFKVTMPETYRDLTSGQHGGTHGTRRPRIWDSFEAHRKWRNAQDDNSFLAQEIVDKIVDTARQVGVRNVIGALSESVSKVLGSDPSVQQDTSKGNTGKSRGKAKIRWQFLLIIIVVFPPSHMY